MEANGPQDLPKWSQHGIKMLPKLCQKRDRIRSSQTRQFLDNYVIPTGSMCTGAGTDTAIAMAFHDQVYGRQREQDQAERGAADQIARNEATKGDDSHAAIAMEAFANSLLSGNALQGSVQFVVERLATVPVLEILWVS